MDMTVAQFAKKFKVDRRTVYRWIKNKAMPPGYVAKVHLTRLYVTDENK